ncbi:single-stranded-DNA-specific exonuclease RecJ [Patescibacteria group bacterium]|nr:single-stranded-DNA-specific exonuclease RecJ [Patescibacteria group bacterium]MBU1673048.1 single-stranded-DNA-specific exonuclease RecJ [Patescibacteria group bacterium]MBU1963280.1 single-stranded-DNA-specific exonuclease RecJ [Patescibacteria group bacterium]
MNLNWLIADSAPEDYLKNFPEFNPIITQLLYNRDFKTQEEVDNFLNPEYSAGQHDPFLFKDMKKAVARILEAIEKQEEILVYGDYDADGVCSSAIIMKVLEKLGAKKISIYIPHRETEGYGINMEAAQKFIEEKKQLIITVDCGVANAEEVQFLSDNNIDVIITDHHYEPLEMPKAAFAIIDPAIKDEKYPEKEISGTTVAFKLAQALIREKKLGEAFEKWLLDLVAISIVTDCIPVRGESRTLLKFGLLVLNKTQRVGLKKLIANVMKNQGEKITTQFIAFRIGPRINAAGRLDHANTAFRLLMTEDENEANDLVDQLNETNVRRQKISGDIKKDVEKQIQDQKNAMSFYGYGEQWPLGVVGIVAGKVADDMNRPTMIFTKNNGEITGSGRSIDQFNMIEALQACEHLFARYGGHSQAAGFTLKENISIDEFKTCFSNMVASKLKDQDLRKTIDIEAKISLDDINWDLYSELEKFEPYGQSNWRPNFLAESVAIVDFQNVGSTNKHLRLVAKSPQGKTMKFIGFNWGHLANKIDIGLKADIVFDIDVNEWNGNRELQCKIIDFKLVNGQED